MTAKELVRAHADGQIDTMTLITSIGTTGYDAYRQEAKDAEAVQAICMAFIDEVRQRVELPADLEAEAKKIVNGEI